MENQCINMYRDEGLNGKTMFSMEVCGGGKITSISRGSSVMDTSSLNVGIFRQSLGIFMGI